MISAAPTAQRRPAIFLYEQTDVPEGLTLDEWRCARARERRAAERERRRARRAALVGWIHL